MDKTLVPVRDLTDSDQNQAVLDAASALAEGRAAADDVEASHGPAVGDTLALWTPPRDRA